MCGVWGSGLCLASGQVIFQLSPRKGEDAFMAFLDHLAQELPADEPVVVVLDNAGYHKSHALREHWRSTAGTPPTRCSPSSCLPTRQR